VLEEGEGGQMKNLIIVVVLLIAGYFTWQKIFHNNQLEALYDEPYVAVYGRDSCGWTQKYLRDLESEGIEFIYERVDSQEVCDELHPRMEKAGLDTRRYNLPVIDVNGQMFIRPEVNQVLAAYEKNE
jgi:hypothetical protein